MAGRITQQRTEVIRQSGNLQNARATQVVVEQVNKPDNLQKARCTQIVIEVITIDTGVSGFVWNPFTFS